jgi:coenzyme F420 hydrogenase subunit beta
MDWRYSEITEKRNSELRSQIVNPLFTDVMLTVFSTITSVTISEQMSNSKNIENVIEEGLCFGCGTCLLVCPTDSIKMEIDHSQGIYFPHLDKENCTQCGKCIQVCPGQTVDFKLMNQEIFGKIPQDVLFGNYSNCYIGHANDNAIRFNATSGGLITTLLVFALEQKMINGALVTRMNPDKPLQPQPFIARTREEIINASKSKYCPVPVNIALKEILNSKEGEKFAVVGLPCHIEGMRKAEAINKKLKDKILLHFGLFCAHTDGFRQTEFVLNKYGIKKDQVKSFQYRGHGWPGSVVIRLASGKECLIPFRKYINWHMLWLYSPHGCQWCIDGCSEFADASFGDAWLPEYRQDNLGKSVVIARNDIANGLINKAIETGKIQLTNINIKKIAESQISLLYSKKIAAIARIRIFQKRKTILSNTLKVGMGDLAFELYERNVFNLLSSRAFYRILKYIPIKFIRLFRLHLDVIPFLRLKSLIKKNYR